MNDPLFPPSERDLPNRERRRAELLAAISTPPAVSNRRVVVPLAAAASVIALTAGGAFAAQSWQSREDVQPQGTPERNSTAPTEPTKSKQESKRETPDVEPAPPVHDLTPQEQADVLEACVGDEPSWQGFEPVLGVRFEQRDETYLVARRGDDRLQCGPTSAGLFGSSTAKDIQYLFAPVDGKSGGFGMYTRPVAKITLQNEHSGGPEQQAVLRDGYWFLPIVDYNTQPVREAKIGVPLGYTIRGYDANGELVYDSDQDGPTLTCYTDPEGQEVLVHNGVDGGNPDPDDCRRTFYWRP